MDKINLIESILYMANSPININQLCNFFKLDYQEMLDLILELKKNRDDTGINIKISDNLVMLSTNAKYSESLQNFFNIEVKTRKLSQSHMEVLAIIAYRKKATKSEIESIRKVNVDSSIKTLLEKNLIYSKERKNVKGKPKLYEVTDDFYKYLGLESEEEIQEILKISNEEYNED